MALTERLIKGLPLTYAELDENFNFLNNIGTGNTQALISKVDVVTGKSLIADTEITRLASVTNQDLTAVTATANAALPAAIFTTYQTTNNAAVSGATAIANAAQPKVNGMGLSTNDYTTVEKSKLGSITGTNTGDQDLTAINSAITTNTNNITAVTTTANNALPTATFTTFKAGNTSDTVQTLRAGINAAIPLLNAEVVAFVAKLQAVGIIDNATINALDTFIADVKAGGPITDIVQFCPMVGSNLASGLLKLIVDPAGSNSLVSSGTASFVEADFQPKLGFSLSANTGKKLSTGVIPNSISLAYNNIGVGWFNPSPTLETGSGLPWSDQGTSSTIYRIYAGQTGQIGLVGAGTSTQIGTGTGGIRSQLINYSGTTFNAFVDGVSQLNATSQTLTPITLDTELTLFGQYLNGTTIYCTTSIAYFIVLKGVTQARALGIEQALVKMSTTLGRRQNLGGITQFFGDSITRGVQASSQSKRWSTQLATALGTGEINYGSPGSGLVWANLNLVPGITRYLEALNQPGNNFVMMFPTNDITNDTNTTTGTAATITAVQTASSTILAAMKIKGKRCLLVGFPYRASVAAAKATAYNAAMAASATANGILYVDVLNAMIDTGSPANYIGPDLIHPNDAGYLMIFNHAFAALQGRLYRDSTFDFPSIAANSSADLTITMYGAIAGMIVMIGNPAAPTAGIKYFGFVSAADTITIRAYNDTSAAIDPAAQYLRVTLFLDK